MLLALAVSHAVVQPGRCQELDDVELDDVFETDSWWEASGSAVPSGSPLDRLPAMLGDFFQTGDSATATFRPQVTTPAAATGPVVLDAASNRFVFIDGGNQLLVPGNMNLGNEFVFFRAQGGGTLSETTNAAGITGFFDLERVTVDSNTGDQTVTDSIDIITGSGTVNVTNPVSTAMFSTTPNTARLARSGRSPTDPSLGNVGLVKMASGGSPIPQDRVFFNYSYFDRVPLAKFTSVNRFVPGFERTFADGLMSLEARFPFAASLDSDINLDGSTSTSTAQMGDISVALKSILSQGPGWLVSGGLQVLAPTAEDISYLARDGSQTAEFLQIENEAVHIMPFLGASLASEDGFFLQGFFQIDADANGMPVSVNANPFGNGTMTEVGRLNGATMMYLDLSLGYWMVQEPPDSGRTLTGMMPLVELHVNRSLSETDQVTFDPLGRIGQEDHFQLINTSFGMVFELHHHTNVSVGYATALPVGDDDEFEGEFRLQVSRRFGAR